MYRQRKCFQATEIVLRKCRLMEGELKQANDEPSGFAMLKHTDKSEESLECAY